MLKPQRNRFDEYHTQLKGGHEHWGSADNLSFDAGLVFQYDLFDRSYPRAFEECDVFYADLPWRSGWREFERRAGVEDQTRTYPAFVAAVCDHVAHYGIPTVLVTGRHALPYFTLKPQAQAETALNSNPALALYFNCDRISGAYEAEAILADIASQSSVKCGGDFCCGFGRTARRFAAAGKRFVVSDYNPACIRYIEDNPPC